LHHYATSISIIYIHFNSHFQVSPGELFLPRTSSSSCSGRQFLRISGTGFFTPDALQTNAMKALQEVKAMTANRKKSLTGLILSL